MKDFGFRGFYRDKYDKLRETVTRRTGRTYRPKNGDTTDREASRIAPINEPDAEKFSFIEPWRCQWCGEPNPVGAKVCEACYMVRTE